MMALEYLAEQKSKYQNKQEYFKKIGFDALATDFQGVVALLEEMEKHLEEECDGKD